MAQPDMQPFPPMPIRATPYRHQKEAFQFVCGLFGLAQEEVTHVSPIRRSCGAALLMEM